MKLKKIFHLEKFKICKIQRCLNSPIPFYYIYFDSKFIQSPITTGRINQNQNITKLVYSNYNLKDMKFTPLMDLDDFNGSLRGRLFCTIDLCGQYYQNQKMFTESVQTNKLKSYLLGNIYQLLEGSGFNIADLRKNAVSNITKKYYKLRHSDEGHQGSTLESVIWDQSLDSLLLQFFIIPTYKQKVKTVDINGNQKTDNHYEVEIMFEEISKWLGTKKEFLNLQPKEQISKIREMIKKGEVKIHSNDMSWRFQGGESNAADLGYEIYDFKGPKGKGIWSKRHMGENPAIYITKHILEVLTVIPFIPQEILKMIKESK